ncbi:MAG TPA: Calx-beta domain-containing protein, partial [Solimonas sp.]|nr:Calx-beta domain-containing protein [Solimonas sp.]
MALAGLWLLAAAPLPAAAAVKLQIESLDYFATEGGPQLAVNITRSGGNAGAVGVSYTTANDSALAGSDYSATNGTLSWPDGDGTARTLLVPLLNDSVYEDAETFKLKLSAPTGGAELGRAAATVYLDDNDTGLAFSQSGYSVGEGAAVGITVYRRGRLSGAVSIGYTTTSSTAKPGSDYTTASGTLSWPSGDGKPRSFAVQTLQDAVAEPLEQLKLNLSSPTGASIHGSAIVSMKIADDDGVAIDTGNPVMFVTQVPVSGFLVVSSPFGAQEGYVHKAPRGGDLMIRYADGTLRNLTQEAGYGSSGFQGANGIAVRQPSVHWNGQKAVFSMVVGGAAQQYQLTNPKWQLYEVSGFLAGQTVKITKLPGQPSSYNNIAPTYASDGQVIFISDRPRSGLAHLYPQRDEYESANVDTGLWKLDPVAKTFKIIQHAPSGVTYPSVDTAGRVIFTKWDHLQRDQQADADAFSAPGTYKYGAFNYASETQTTVPPVHSMQEFFPELRRAAYSKPFGAGYDGSTPAADYPYDNFTFNHFFPWMLNQDGSEEETLNHVGRQEIGGTYSEGSFRSDSNLPGISFGQFTGGGIFLSGDGGMFHLREDPAQPGMFYGTQAPEFSTHTAGDIVRLYGRKDVNPEDMRLERIISRSGVGRLRNPLPLANGQLLVAHTATEDDETNLGTTAAPVYNYGFRLRSSRIVDGKRVPDAFLTGGITKAVNYWSPDVKVSWSGTLWELDPVEVRTRTAPARTVAPQLPAPERQVLTAQSVNYNLLRNWLHSKNLALVVMRNVTRRDRGDTLQPFNLNVSVPNGISTVPKSGTVYDISRMQFFQGDQIRGYASGKPPQQGGTPSPGRRVLAVPLHDPAAIAANQDIAGGLPPGSYPIAADGSVAAFLPAQRAMAWQTVDSTGKAIVRERNWISFKPGETRSCNACHGINKLDQAGATEPENAPQALGTLLASWKNEIRNAC